MLNNIRNLLYLLIVILPFAVFGQNPIPNTDFENWTNNVPDGWFSNSEAITPSNDAYSGNYSARMEVVEFLGFPLPPQLVAGDGFGFPVSERYTNLSGYYKLNPQPGDFINVIVQMYNSGGTNLIGTGHGTYPEATGAWTKFSIDINYLNPAVPDHCYLELGVGIFDTTGGVGMIDHLEFTSTTGVKELLTVQIPDRFELMQNYPNPFNSTTNIQFSIPAYAYVNLVVFNTLGKQVERLVSEELDAGTYNHSWNATYLTSGIYFLRIEAGSFKATKKMILLK